ncbi:neutral zinc metallopeptidase, partial [Diaphorobacter sp.]
MRWEGNRESDNVEDRRSGGGGGFIGGRSIGI